MKRWIALLLALCLMISLAACRREKPGDNPEAKVDPASVDIAGETSEVEFYGLR